MATDAGFTADRVLTAGGHAARAPATPPPQAFGRFHDAAFREAAALPGVRSAALDH